jgi:lipopolysaccharide export system ATP-binding protein
VHELKIENLVKTIKKHEIVRGISMELHTGEVVGLLGPNGAGKTTTFYMVCGLIEATAGKVYIDGEDVSFAATQTFPYGDRVFAAGSFDF